VCEDEGISSARESRVHRLREPITGEGGRVYSSAAARSPRVIDAGAGEGPDGGKYWQERTEHLAAEALTQIRTDPRSPGAFVAFVDGIDDPPLPTPADDHTSVDEQAKFQIRDSRRRLTEFPWDGIARIDLARGFTNLGLTSKADRCVMAGLQLSPTNRFVLRASARFYVYRRDPDKAQALLRKTPNLINDPWLLASEIAISSHMRRASVFARNGIKLLGADFAPEDLTELAAALGTLETDEGHIGRAKKFLRQSLKGTNENSLAQVEWVDRTRLGGVIVEVNDVNPPEQHEALAWRAFFEGNWGVAARESTLWFRDQTFSKNASVLNSYVLSDFVGDQNAAITYLNLALRCNPRDVLLSNNIAFCYIKLNDLETAETILSKIPADESSDNRVIDATRGLLEFRKGNPPERKRALPSNESDHDTGHAGRAATHLAIEEILAGTDHIVEAVKRSLELTTDSKRPDIIVKVKELEALVKDYIAFETASPMQ
jgi:tetratricopeptide (TPR) repeat protein